MSCELSAGRQFTRDNKHYFPENQESLYSAANMIGAIMLSLPTKSMNLYHMLIYINYNRQI